MRPRQEKFTLFLFVLLITLFCGCSQSETENTAPNPQTASQLLGTWRQTAIGEQKVSGITVEITFSGATLTMDAPGCLIIGSYIIEGDILTYTITSTRGEQCATDQTIGKSDRVHFTVKASDLMLSPLSGGKEQQATYRRVSTSLH